jgi:RNA-binding protein YhbY
MPIDDAQKMVKTAGFAPVSKRGKLLIFMKEEKAKEV